MILIELVRSDNEAQRFCVWLSLRNGTRVSFRRHEHAVRTGITNHKFSKKA